MDLPIIIKKESIKLFGLFNSITLYLKEDIAIFTGMNIPLSYFIQLFMYDDVEGLKLYGEFVSKHKKNYTHHTDQDIINYFNNKFDIKGPLENIINSLERMFFDSYTRNLYEACYGMKFDITLKNILTYAMTTDIENKPPNFVDLKFKRVVFLEILLRPLFERVLPLIKMASKGSRPDELKMDALTIMKFFLSSNDSKKKRVYGKFISRLM
jgi:hypothetical protein